MMFPDPKTENEKKINDIQFKLIMLVCVSTIIFCIVMYPIVMM